ncbi:MAG TPA: CHAP domain-containing protein [Ktedonobacteraceae bacterium]
MPSFKNRESSVTGELQLPGQVNQLSPVEQLPFPSNGQFAVKTTRHLAEPSGYTPPPGFTAPLGDPSSSTSITGVLPDIQTGALSTPFTRNTTTTALRQPIVIRASGKKKSGSVRPPQGRRWVISASVVFLMMLISLGTAMAVAPTGGETGHGFNPFQFVSNMVQSNSSNPSLVAQQAATATAVTYQGSSSSSNNNPTPAPYYGGGSGGGGLYRFAFGECTYWANMRYHALTGFWVPWLGDAYQWSYGAQASGWVVSSTPRVPSIIVLQPGVQGAGGLGHVAIVESINKDGSVYASNMNWYAGGGWDTVSYYTFYPGSGVSFVWR